MQDLTIRFSDMTPQQFQAHLDDRSVNTHDAAAVAVFFTDDAVQRRVATGETAHGRAAISAAMAETFRVFPDFHVQVRVCFGSWDTMCAECTFTGTHEAAWLGVAATGHRIEVEGCLVLRLAPDGLVEEETIYLDSATILRQLGVGP